MAVRSFEEDARPMDKIADLAYSARVTDEISSPSGNTGGEFFCHIGSSVHVALTSFFGRGAVCDAQPACSSLRSMTPTGTRNSFPILIVGISPRAAAA